MQDTNKDTTFEKWKCIAAFFVFLLPGGSILCALIFGKSVCRKIIKKLQL